MRIFSSLFQVLKEEIVRQQAVISQTSQALNLCHSTAEFSGSSEQIEAERLLLIASKIIFFFLNMYIFQNLDMFYVNRLFNCSFISRNSF